MSQEKPTIEIKDELERFMKLHQFERIEDVLKLNEETLLKMNGCGMRLMIEIHRLRLKHTQQ